MTALAALLKDTAGSEGADELEDFGFGGHGVVHVPAFGFGALGGGAVVLGEESAAGTLGLEHDFVLLL